MFTMINLEIINNTGRNCLWDSREVLAAPSLGNVPGWVGQDLEQPGMVGGGTEIIFKVLSNPNPLCDSKGGD